LVRLRDRLVAAGVLSEEAADELQLDAEHRIARAVEEATSQPFPDASAAFEDVYA
jgi:TPP-dependent pyruvate/acetoin dehydrogenase alpha subunit